MKKIKTTPVLVCLLALTTASVPAQAGAPGQAEPRQCIRSLRDMGRMLTAARAAHPPRWRAAVGREASLVARTMAAAMQIRQSRADSQGSAAAAREITPADAALALRIATGREPEPRPAPVEPPPVTPAPPPAPEPAAPAISMEQEYAWPRAKARLNLKIAARMTASDGKPAAVLRGGGIVKVGDVMSAVFEGRTFEWTVVSVAGDEVAVEQLRAR